MTFAAPDPVSSGRPYPVLVVGSGAATGLHQFESDTRFTIDKDRAQSTICGSGAPDGDGVRFHEKDLDTGKDVRTWRISRSSGDQFTAQPAATS